MDLDIGPLLDLIPPSWREPLALVGAVLVATTPLVHALLPLARWLERRAAQTPATWDDHAARRLVRTLDTVAWALRGVAAVLPRVAIGRLGDDTTPPSAPRRRQGTPGPAGTPSSSGTAALALLIFAAALSAATTGCGMSATEAGRRALENTARVSARLDRELAAARLRVSEQIRARPDATREEHDAAMRPFDDALQATLVLHRAHYAAQAALDAAEHGEAAGRGVAGSWRALMGCVLSSLGRLVGIASDLVDVPNETGDVLQQLAGFADEPCPDPSGGAQ